MTTQTIDRRNALGLLLFGGMMAWSLTRSKTSYDVPEISIAEAKSRIDAGAWVVDVRGLDAFNARHLPTAMFVALNTLRAGIPLNLIEAKTKSLVVYCADGVSSGPEGTHLLVQAGFTQVANMKTGIEGWVAAGLPVVKS